MLSRPAAEAGVALITTALIAVALGRNPLGPEQLGKFGVQGTVHSGKRGSSWLTCTPSRRRSCRLPPLKTVANCPLQRLQVPWLVSSLWLY